MLRRPCLPDDWQIFYFGCQHLAPPKRVNDGVVRVTRALDTHAVAKSTEVIAHNSAIIEQMQRKLLA